MRRVPACVTSAHALPDPQPSFSTSSDGLEVTVGARGAISVVVVRGAIDVAHCRHLSLALDHALATAPERLVIDLCAAELIDSIGLAVLVQARRRALRQGIALVLVCDVPSTLKVFTLTGLDRSFDVCPTHAAALSTRAR